MMKEAVEQRGGDDRIAEHLAPFCKATIGGEDHGAALVAGVDELEEQIAAARDDRQISDLVHDQEGMSAKEVCVQPVSATPLAVYRLAFGSPRSFAGVD